MSHTMHSHQNSYIYLRTDLKHCKSEENARFSNSLLLLVLLLKPFFCRCVYIILYEGNSKLIGINSFFYKHIHKRFLTHLQQTEFENNVATKLLKIMNTFSFCNIVVKYNSNVFVNQRFPYICPVLMKSSSGELVNPNSNIFKYIL